MTDPFVYLSPGRKMTDEEVRRAIRENIMAEHDATSTYEAHIQSTDNEAVKAVLQHIVDEEKTHIGELMALLESLDHDQLLLGIKGAGHAEKLIAGEEVED